jgi:VWFA-related protein
LIDSGNLAWADWAYAREEMLRFLGSLPANERVGLYVMKALGFQVMEEETVDHALLASKLRKWMPSPQDVARAQEEETHNRQLFDTVRSAADLQCVNGNLCDDPETSNPLDLQLRDKGSNPGRDALPILAGVARHLAAIPGHKNLVWVSSDNVLADWTDRAVSSDKGTKRLDELVLHAQEVLNQAHVSVYPLDASQLEGSTVEPSLQALSVGLDPGSMGPPPPRGFPGRIIAQGQQDVHPIQAPIQELAEATGGRSFPRSGEIAAHLNQVVAEGRASYLLGFTPDAPADDQYHLLTVKVTARSGITLRYRTGYLYSKEPATLKERFRQAVWQPLDVNEIAVSAIPVIEATGSALELTIATNDLALKQQDDRRMDKLDIFLVQRDEQGLHARITGQTFGLALKSGTYQEALAEGVSFKQLLEKKQGVSAVRVVVVDENSGRMGSVTVPAAGLLPKPR